MDLSDSFIVKENSQRDVVQTKKQRNCETKKHRKGIESEECLDPENKTRKW